MHHFALSYSYSHLSSLSLSHTYTHTLQVWLSKQRPAVPGHAQKPVEDFETILTNARMHVLIGDPLSDVAYVRRCVLCQLEIHIPAVQKISIGNMWKHWLLHLRAETNRLSNTKCGLAVRAVFMSHAKVKHGD